MRCSVLCCCTTWLCHMFVGQAMPSTAFLLDRMKCVQQQACRCIYVQVTGWWWRCWWPPWLFVFACYRTYFDMSIFVCICVCMCLCDSHRTQTRSVYPAPRLTSYFHHVFKRLTEMTRPRAYVINYKKPQTCSLLKVPMCYWCVLSFHLAKVMYSSSFKTMRSCNQFAKSKTTG